MKRLLVALVAAALALGGLGCFKHTYTLGTGAADGRIVYKHWHHHWLFGTIRPELQKDLLLAQHCPSGNATIHQEVSFVNGLVDLLTTFIYAPTTVTITCDDGSEVEIDVDEGAAQALIDSPEFPDVVADVVPERLPELQVALAERRQRTGDLLLVAP